MHCLCCFAQKRKHLHFASMATQQGNLYESTFETNEDLKILLNHAEDFNLSLKPNPENSPCSRFFNLMLKKLFCDLVGRKLFQWFFNLSSPFGLNHTFTVILEHKKAKKSTFNKIPNLDVLPIQWPMPWFTPRLEAQV